MNKIPLVVIMKMFFAILFLFNGCKSYATKNKSEYLQIELQNIIEQQIDLKLFTSEGKVLSNDFIMSKCFYDILEQFIRSKTSLSYTITVKSLNKKYHTGKSRYGILFSEVDTIYLVSPDGSKYIILGS